MKRVRIGRSNEFVPAIGQGTWKMGDDRSLFNREVDALRLGIELGLTMIDTAEMYAAGGAERVVAEAIRDCRSNVFLVTKVWPYNASYHGVIEAAKRSLSRLQTDQIDLYLLHWPSDTHPVSETMRAMKELLRSGAIRYAGVSNFDVALMKEAQDALGEYPLTCNQVSYHLKDREIEAEILPYCQEHQITVMAYSPLGQGDFPAPGTEGRRLLDEIGAKHGATAYQVALSWVISHENVVAIPKASDPKHVRENAAALQIELTPEEKQLIAEHFPVDA